MVDSYGRTPRRLSASFAAFWQFRIVEQGLLVVGRSGKLL